MDSCVATIHALVLGEMVAQRLLLRHTRAKYKDCSQVETAFILSAGD